VRIKFIEGEVRIHLACPKTDGRSAKLVSIRPCLRPVLAHPRVRWCAGLGCDGRRRGRGSSSPLQPLLFSLQLSLSLSWRVAEDRPAPPHRRAVVHLAPACHFWIAKELVSKLYEMCMQHFITPSLKAICRTDHTCSNWGVIVQGRMLPDNWVRIEIQR